MESNLSTFKEIGAHIRIVGVNNDKTRKTDGSDVLYQVYFQLSGIPTRAWGTLFEEKWKVLNTTQPDLWQAASIEGKFLVVRCPLQDVASTYLPLLKKAVAETDTGYGLYLQQVAKEQRERRDVWERERNAVDAMAQSLHFEPND